MCAKSKRNREGSAGEHRQKAKTGKAQQILPGEATDLRRPSVSRFKDFARVGIDRSSAGGRRLEE
jgi:hypothetical protein